MAKTVHDDVLDAALNYIKNNATRLTLCNAQPTTYTEANATFALADVTIDTGDFTGPANGDTSGRKIAVNAQTGVDVDVTDAGGTNHVALLDVVNSKLLYVTTAADVAVDAAGTVDIGAWDIEIADPA
jgi:hypothetical protein